MVAYHFVANQSATHPTGNTRCSNKPVLFSKNLLWMPLSEGYFLKEKTER